MTRDEMQKLWSDVKHNHKRLNECAGPHDFVATASSSDVSGHDQRYRCTKCEGVVDLITHHWYRLGLEHGRRP